MLSVLINRNSLRNINEYRKYLKTVGRSENKKKQLFVSILSKINHVHLWNFNEADEKVILNLKMSPIS